MPEILKQILSWTVAAVFMAGLLAVLGAIIRFSIISPILTHGTKAKIRKPAVRELESFFKIRIPRSLERFYLHNPVAVKQELTIGDLSLHHKNRLEIGEFYPLTTIHVKEAIRVHGVDGLPIASDMDKGVYYLKFSDMAPDSSDETVPLYLNTGRGETCVLRDTAILNHFGEITEDETPN